MAIVRYTAGNELTPERRAAMKAEIEAAAKRPYVYDPDCPLLTEEQLAEFRPVNFASMEERARYMKSQHAPTDATVPISSSVYSRPCPVTGTIFADWDITK